MGIPFANTLGDSCCWALKPAGRPLPHCRGGNGPPSATRCLRGGGAVVDSKNIYVMWIVLRAVPTLAPSTHFMCFYFLQLHFRGHFRVHFRISTPTFIWGRTVVSIVLDVYIRLYSTPTLSCGRTAVSTVPDICRRLFLRLHSSVDGQRSLQCQTSVDVSILRLHLSVDAQRSLHTSLLASSLQSTYHTCFYVYACLCSLHSTLQRPITCLVFKVAKSAWLHFTHQTETSLFSTFYTYI